MERLTAQFLLHTAPLQQRASSSSFSDCAPTKISFLKIKTKIKAKLSHEKEDDPSIDNPINAASLRFQETHRAEPLVVDPYAGCLIPPITRMEMKRHTHHYLLATKFIDDKLLRTLSHIDGLKQVVLFTDGMDTRPYRLNWPTSTVLFEISPERVFKMTAKKLQDVGAKVPRSCLFFHIPLESSNILQLLQNKGFNGNRPSIWAIQGLPVMTLASFEEILSVVSSLAMNGCLFLGELPAWLADTEIGGKSNTRKWLEKVFMTHGFRVNIINYDETARTLGKELMSTEYKNILYVAEQLQFSDDQVEIWRKEFKRVEEEGDEEGFEEL